MRWSKWSIWDKYLPIELENILGMSLKKYLSWLAVIDNNYSKNDTFMENLSLSNRLTIVDKNIAWKLEYRVPQSLIIEIFVGRIVRIFPEKLVGDGWCMLDENWRSTARRTTQISSEPKFLFSNRWQSLLRWAFLDHIPIIVHRLSVICMWIIRGVCLWR